MHDRGSVLRLGLGPARRGSSPRTGAAPPRGPGGWRALSSVTALTLAELFVLKTCSIAETNIRMSPQVTPRSVPPPRVQSVRAACLSQVAPSGRCGWPCEPRGDGPRAGRCDVLWGRAPAHRGTDRMTRQAAGALSEPRSTCLHGAVSRSGRLVCCPHRRAGVVSGVTWFPSAPFMQPSFSHVQTVLLRPWDTSCSHPADDRCCWQHAPDLRRPAPSSSTTQPRPWLSPSHGPSA